MKAPEFKIASFETVLPILGGGDVIGLEFIAKGQKVSITFSKKMLPAIRAALDKAEHGQRTPPFS